MNLDGDTTLAQAQAALNEVIEKGENCPCCGQFAKVYTRRIHANMARALILFYRQHGLGWGDRYESLPDDRLSADFAKMRYWGLIEEDEQRREDGTHSGRWRVTEIGEGWILGRYTVHKYARIYDSLYLGLTGKQVTIQDALGKRFRLDELMAA